MSEKKLILGIVGSPRKNRSCNFLIEEALNGAKEASEDVVTEKLFLVDYKLQQCTGCDQCLREPYDCPLSANDDFKKLEEKVLSAHAILLAAPSYFGSPSGLTKVLIDRSRPWKMANYKMKDILFAPVAASGLRSGGAEGVIASLVNFALTQGMVVFGALAGGMSYYLNSTLFAISSLMELLKGEIANKEKISSLSTLITGEIRRGLSVTNNLMKLAHPDRLALRPLSVVVLVGSVCDEFRSQVPKSIRVDTHFAQDTPTILGDRELFRQLLLNLLANAKDAMPEGGILGICTAYRTDSSKGDSKEAVPQGTHLSLRISDNGSGMDEDTRRQIFEPFFTTNTDGNRLGLGLSFEIGRAHV